MSPPNLSRAEYDILNIIWKHGQQSVREVHDRISPKTNWAYTTTKTMMDRLVKKSFLTRNQFHGVFVYDAIVTRPAGLARLIHFFTDRVLELDRSIVLGLLGQNDSLSKEEIEELSQLLDEIEAEEGKHD